MPRLSEAKKDVTAAISRVRAIPLTRDFRMGNHPICGYLLYGGRTRELKHLSTEEEKITMIARVVASESKSQTAVWRRTTGVVGPSTSDARKLAETVWKAGAACESPLSKTRSCGERLPEYGHENLTFPSLGY